MRLAVKLAGIRVDEDGHVAGHDAGATLVRRLLRVFPGAQLIGEAPRRAAGFDVVPLDAIDGANTVVVNMDVLDSVHVWEVLHGMCDEPRVMNFLWWSSSEVTHPVQRAELALACALFPTFANSEHTATEVREIVDALTVKPLAAAARIGWVNLGFRLEHVQPRREPDVPVVLYPAITLASRKRPELFIAVVSRVAAKTPILVEARLTETHLVRELAMDLGDRRWAWVGPLTATREGYWQALARTTAFLATSSEESYGLEYVEALAAGAVGVFPDLAWARELLPPTYPFLFRSEADAESMLLRAVTDTDACRAELDACAGGDFAGWLQQHHSDDGFDRAIVEHVDRWFGDRPDVRPDWAG